MLAPKWQIRFVAHLGWVNNFSVHEVRVCIAWFGRLCLYSRDRGASRKSSPRLPTGPSKQQHGRAPSLIRLHRDKGQASRNVVHVSNC
jgi:hypothetical protein